MDNIESLGFPAIALTPNGVMPYSQYENLLRVMKHEYEMGWFNDIEVIGIDGISIIIRSASIVAEPLLAKVFGRMVKVQVNESFRNVENEVDSIRERVLQHLSLHPDMYVSAGVYDNIVNDVAKSKTTRELVEVFAKLVS